MPATPNAIVHAEGWVDVVFHGSVPASTTRLAWDGGEVLEARWFPVDKRLIETPFWKDTSDPHKVVEVRQYTQRPQTPWPHVFNHKIIQVNAENSWGKAVTRVVLENWGADKAVDELIARIKQVAG